MKANLSEFDLMGFLPYRMTVAADKLSLGLAKRYRTEYGISIAEWRVLVHLLHSREVSVRDIEKRVNLDKSKASRAASRLESDGYITKTVNADDRRLVRLTLTDKGRGLMAEIIPLAIEYQKKLEQLIAGHMAGLEAAIDIILEQNE